MDDLSAALESESPTVRLMARYGLGYREFCRVLIHRLGEWVDRCHEDGSGKGEFDLSEPGFSDLLDQSCRIRERGLPSFAEILELLKESPEVLAQIDKRTPLHK